MQPGADVWRGAFARCMGLVFCLTAGVRAGAAEQWSVYQHDIAHTGYTSASLDPKKLNLIWSAPIGYATPLIVGDNVIAMHNGQGTGTSSTVSSFRLSDGHVNWSFTGNYDFPSQASYGNGMVVFSGGITGADSGKLIVLDAQTGVLKYKVAVGLSGNMTTLVPEADGTTSGYVTAGSTLKGVSLGATSGAVLWTATGSYGGQSIPTIAGSSVLLAGPDHYYAIDRATGAQNHFHNGSISGGGGDTVAYDAARNEFYVLDDYGGITPTLTAYQYGGTYNSITRLWGITGTGIRNGGQVAIGPTGNVYAVDNANLIEIDPVTGAILRTKSGQSFSNAVAPLIAGNDLWAYNDNNTVAYDLSTLALVRTLPGSRGSLNTAFDSPGAVDDFHYLIDYGDIYNSPGFDVYAVPEPACLGVCGAAGGMLLLLHRQPRRRGGSRSPAPLRTARGYGRK